jgi:hypothetical protein
MATTIRVVVTQEEAVQAAGDMENQGLHVMTSSAAGTVVYSDPEEAKTLNGFVVIGFDGASIIKVS